MSESTYPESYPENSELSPEAMAQHAQEVPEKSGAFQGYGEQCSAVKRGNGAQGRDRTTNTAIFSRGAASSTVHARATDMFTVPDTLVTASVPTLATASKRPETAAAQQLQFAAAASTVPPDGGSPSTVVVPRIAATTVSRGDSLWRISRLTYGAGTRYAVIYKANREQIRHPNLIHPRPDPCRRDAVKPASKEISTATHPDAHGISAGARPPPSGQRPGSWIRGSPIRVANSNTFLLRSSTFPTKMKS
jgi:nucleoid-associated protein YgaU